MYEHLFITMEEAKAQEEYYRELEAQAMEEYGDQIYSLVSRVIDDMYTNTTEGIKAEVDRLKIEVEQLKALIKELMSSLKGSVLDKDKNK